MTRSNYVKWSRYSILSEAIGAVTWMSLSTFVLMSRNAVGTSNVPIFEVIIFMSALIGIKIAHSKWAKLSGSILGTIVQESIFSIVLMAILLSNPSNLTVAGYVVYSVIVGSAFLHKITSETTRSYEQRSFSTPGANNVLKRIRKRGELTISIGGAIGSMIALVCISVLKIDIVAYATVMLLLNMIQNGYDYYLWNTYLK